jgi:hypothetical protein
MCVKNTCLPYQNDPTLKSSRTLKAAFPYENNKKVLSSSNVTPLQKLKIAENRVRKSNALKKEREEYFAKIREEETNCAFKKNKCATKIQAIFRGFRRRLKSNSYCRKRRFIPKVSMNQIQNELGSLANSISLKPISGLTLEPHGKASRRRAKIVAAAANQIKQYMRMVVERKKARRRMKCILEEKIAKSARAIQKFFRFVKITCLKKNLDRVRREHAATTVQKYTRRFFSQKRYCNLLFLKSNVNSIMSTNYLDVAC